MPTAPLRPCIHPGCPALVATGSRCERHAKPHCAAVRRDYDQTTRKTDPALAWAARVRNSARWQRVRHSHKSANPICCDPFKEHGEFAPLATITNHITPLRVCFATGQHEKAFDLDNLASLCTSCDARIGAMERSGESTTHLFVNNKPPDLSFGCL